MPTEIVLPCAWQQCVTAFLADIESRSGSRRSRETYAGILALFFADCAKHPNEVTRADVLAFAESPSHGKRAGRPVAISTRNGRVSCLTSFYRFAATYLVDGVPLFTRQSPLLGIRYLKPEIRYRNVQWRDFARILSVIPDSAIGWRDKCAFLLFFWLGRRRTELLALRYGDIQPALLIDTDGTRRAGYTYVYRNKGAKRQERVKEFPLPAWDILHAYLCKSGRLARIQPEDYVIAPLYPGRGRKDGARDQPLSGVQLSERLRFYCEQADVAPYWTLHTLRHLAAWERYNAGVDVRTIQAYLGHASLSTTDVYLRQLVGESDPSASLLIGKVGPLSHL